MRRPRNRKVKSRKIKYNTDLSKSDEEIEQAFTPRVIEEAKEEIQRGWNAKERARRVVEPSPDMILPKGYDPYERRKGRDNTDD